MADTDEVSREFLKGATSTTTKPPRCPATNYRIASGCAVDMLTLVACR